MSTIPGGIRDQRYLVALGVRGNTPTRRLMIEATYEWASGDIVDS
jgi:hypothetical protein